MSQLLTDKLVTPCGDITTSAAGGYLDAAGNVFGSPGFLPNYVVDYAGNLGFIPLLTNNCAVVATIIGTALPPGPWEMQLGTVETVGAHLGSIATNYVNAGNLTSFASLNTIGYVDGNISGTGTFNIKAGPQTIAGVTYGGNGLQIFTGTNTCAGIFNMEAGTNVQFGDDCSNAVTKWAGNLTIQTGATATQYTSFPNATYLCQALTNTGTYNVIGCGTCGVGGINYASTVANNGVINIDDAAWAAQSTWSGAGTVNVKDGGTLVTNAAASGSTNTININGCGWCGSTGATLGAINVASTGTFTAKIKVQTASCIKANTNQSTTFSGVLSGGAPLNVSSLAATKPNAIQHFTNTANTYYGTMTVDGTTINASHGTSLQYAKIVLANGGRLGSSASQTIGSLASTDPTTYWSSADSLSHFIKNNGITTFAGRLLWNGGSNTANFYLEGGSSNVLTMTGTGSTGNLYVRNGSKVIMQGGTWTGTNGQIRASAGSTVSAGTSTTGSAVLIYLDATSALDVYASGASTGIINTGTGTSLLSAGWKVNLKDPLPAGTHVIWKNTGAAITQLPVIGENLSGRTVVSFAWNNAVTPKTLSVILA
jgi:hypothetical protein